VALLKVTVGLTTMDAGTGAAEQGPCSSWWQPRGSTAARERSSLCAGQRPRPCTGAAVAGPRGWVRTTATLKEEMFAHCANSVVSS
jgi:hypothetical protein